MDKVERSDAEWRATLTPEQYRILRQAGTEAPGSGALLHVKDKGEFRCAACGEPLFSSAAVSEQSYSSHGMVRTEVRCARCEGHLGHVFPDGPGPAGLRYCINSGALAFDKSKDD